MLVLSRKMNESIKIDDDVTITVVALDNGKVRLGIDAPKSVRIDRQEVWERKQANGEIPGAVISQLLEVREKVGR